MRALSRNGIWRAMLVSCLSALCAPSAQGLPELPIVETVFEHPRPNECDAVHLRDKSVLTGAVLTSTFTLETPYGTVAVPAERCAGISIAKGLFGKDVLLTVNYNRISGELREQAIRLRRESDEKEIEQPVAGIRTIAFRIRPGERAFIDRLAGARTNLFSTLDGDLLTGEALEANVELETTEGRVETFDFGDYLSIRRKHSRFRGYDGVWMSKGKNYLGRFKPKVFTIYPDFGGVRVKLSLDDLRAIDVGDGTWRAASALGLKPGPSAPIPPATNPEMTNRVGMRFRLIPAGSFTMGSPAKEHWHNEDEIPEHKATLTKPFYMGETEVTKAQWVKVMGKPLWPEKKQGEDAKSDVAEHRANWNHAVAFAARLSEMDPDYSYRLPTEAEWEYAARAGTTTRFFWGEDRNEQDCGFYMWFNRNAKKAQPAALKKPNAWGLYDTSGNVWEWCSDWYDRYTSPPLELVDPAGPAEGARRVIRGGSWNNHLRYNQSAVRGSLDPGDPKTRDYVDIGFRVVAVPRDPRQ